jgi:hypothetical protein
LYRGLPIQAIGIIPEKALKLSINDALRYRFREADGKIQLAWEGAAGGIAGFCQVIITCPMEVAFAHVFTCTRVFYLFSPNARQIVRQTDVQNSHATSNAKAS